MVTINGNLLKKFYRKKNSNLHSGSNIKVMLMVLFDYEGVVHKVYLSRGQTTNKGYNFKVVKRFRDGVGRKRTHFWSNGG